MDTPGFGDSSGDDNKLIQEMMDILDSELGSANTIVLAIDGSTPRFTSGLQDMLTQMSSIFGHTWWDFMMIGVTKWPYDQASIDDRQDDCDYYGDPSAQCKNEAWFIRSLSQQLEEKFGQNRSFTFAFMDSFSQAGPELDDQVQQQYWIQETSKLWQEATNKNETFDFLTIDDILDENFKCKQENSRLHDIIDEEISGLKDNITVLSTNVSQNADDIDSIGSSIGEIVDQELSIIKDDINDLNKGVDHNADIIAALAVEVTANSMHIQDFSDVINFVNTTLAGMVEENTCAIDELKTNGETNVSRFSDIK